MSDIKLRPVIVYIHPGGFYIGSGRSDFAGPEYLLDEEIVLVTFNYRLGFLGFLSTGDARAPGNAGLKDQVLVLEWVRDNIDRFGGDPNLVTLMGYSAGAFSVDLHLKSAMSQHLFHRAIVMSGGIPPQLSFPFNQTKLIQKQAEQLGCPSQDWYECVFAANASELSQNVYKMFEFGRDNPIFLWLPVIEQDFGQRRFLTHSPVDSDVAIMPLLVGSTVDELATSAQELLNNAKFVDSWKKHFQSVASICLMHELTVNQSNAIWTEHFNSGLSFSAVNRVSVLNKTFEPYIHKKNYTFSVSQILS